MPEVSRRTATYRDNLEVPSFAGLLSSAMIKKGPGNVVPFPPAAE